MSVEKHPYRTWILSSCKHGVLIRLGIANGRQPAKAIPVSFMQSLSFKLRTRILGCLYHSEIGVNRSSEKAGFKQTGKTVVLNGSWLENFPVPPRFLS